MLISIGEECVHCGACEAINPNIFTVDAKVYINPNEISGNEQECIDAALICPVNAIHIDEIL